MFFYSKNYMNNFSNVRMVCKYHEHFMNDTNCFRKLCEHFFETALTLLNAW